VCLLLASLVAFGQAGTGTITGVVTDQTGAVVAGANISAKNSNTGVVFPAASSTTGNYTLAQLPPGTYELNVKVQGFKDYTHKNLQVQVAGIIREDVGLTVGSTGENVTVTAEASMLKTESGDLAHNITVAQLDDLPILGIGNANAGSSGVRNPYGLAQLIPGVQYSANSVMTINGQGGLNAPTAAMRIEGQDMTNHYVSYALQEEQPSADAIQEVAVQTSNYAPEFGTAGSAVFNITMKSGTNQYHGSGYDYFVNEDLNAGYPGSISSVSGGKIRPRNRRNDYGGTLGGPVWIPKLYNGHNKTFFFYNWEQFREKTQLFFGSDTVPNSSYLNGNFSAISPNGNCSLCSSYGVQTTALGNGTKDAQGNQFFANTIYDPTTRGTLANGLGFANPFPGNVIPTARLDPVALKIQALFPAAQNSNLTANYASSIPSVRLTTIPSWKFDESLTSKDKISFYYSTTGTASQISSPNGNADGLPVEIGLYRGTFIDSKIVRLNYDRTLTPTLLLHIGAGWQRLNFFDDAPFLNFNPASFGLTGFLINRQFPAVTGMCVIPLGATNCSTTVGANLGGMQNIGTTGQIQSHSRQQKPSYNLNATYVKGSHTYKVGGEVYFQGTIANPFSGVTLATGTGPTSQPFTNSTSFNGFSTGFGYASFLLGDYASTNQTVLSDTREGKAQWAFFAQDSWKVTRKLTLDYGIRWDLATPNKEQYGRVGGFDPTTTNANAGGRLGATRYAATCNCDFYPSSYKLAFGPRIGVAYQANSKTVVRGGWGIVYQYGADTSFPTISTPGSNNPAGINPIVNIETPNAILQPVWPIVNNPNIYPTVGTTNAAPTMIDANAYRPPRQNQFSFGLQREITRDFVVEASYVGNRLVWLGGPLGFLNQISPAAYAKFGLYPYAGSGPAGYNYVASGLSCTAGNDCDRALLGQAINSPAVLQKMAAAGVGNGGLLLPYTTAPLSTTLQTALRAFPQFPNLAPTGSATGKSKYDSLQVKATKRMSHGLSANGTFTWSKSMQLNGRQDFFNPNSSGYVLNLNDQPILVNLNITYTTPKFTSNRYVSSVAKDWQLGVFAQYGSGQLLTPPGSTLNSIFLGSEDYRVAGQPLYLKSLNCHCINPGYDQVLNPAAWAPVPVNGVGPAIGTSYGDFRGPRRPSENFNIGRNFRVGKEGRYNLQIRGEFANIFNRSYLLPPSTTAPQTAAILGGSTKASSGFGTINAFAAVNGTPTQPTGYGPRTGTVIARFSF
jgi:hypothetical protein